MGAIIPFILHVGTNDLISNTPPNEIARNVVDVAGKLKCEKWHEVILMDKPGLNLKKEIS